MAFVADVFDVIIQDLVTGETIATTTLQEANIEVNVEETEIRGGKGNTLLGILHSARDITISLNDTTFRPEYLARQLGQPIVTGQGIAYAAPKWYTATGTTTVKITLDKAPLSTGHEIKMYKADGSPITSGFTVNGSDVTFSSGVVAGDKIEVRTYKYQSPTNTQTINIDANTFAKGVRVILQTVEVDGDENLVATLQYQFDKAVPNGSFTINTNSQREASAQEMTIRVLKPADTTVVGRLLRIPA